VCVCVRARTEKTLTNVCSDEFARACAYRVQLTLGTRWEHVGNSHSHAYVHTRIRGPTQMPRMSRIFFVKYFFYVHAQTQRMSKKIDKMMEEVAAMHERILSLAHEHCLSHAQAIERIDQLAAQACKDPNSRA